MKRRASLIIGILLVMANMAMANNGGNEVKVRILHNDELVFDTTFTATPDSARRIIEQCVYNYSKDSIFLNPNAIQGLYVFNVSNDFWKDAPAEPGQPVATLKQTPPVPTQIPTEVFWDDKPQPQNEWETLTIDMFVDTLSVVIKELRDEFVKIDFKNDPTVQEINASLQNMFTKIRNTRIMVIEPADAKTEE